MKLFNENIETLNNLENLNLIKSNDLILFHELNQEISVKKKEIDECDNNKWDKMKKLMNPFELVYTTSSKKYKYENFALYKPVSRSYFKLWEMNMDYDLLLKNKNKIIAATLAEGPGGFLEAIMNFRNNKNDEYYGITLQNVNSYIPDWELNEHNNLKIMYGNLYHYESTEKFIDIFKNNKKADIVTADGGFDYSNDYNSQEINSVRIITAELIHAFLILKTDGHYVCKLFDLFSKPMNKIIYILYSFFNEIYIVKPKTSRPANSEKYIICKNFKGINQEDVSNLIRLLSQFNDEDLFDFNLNLPPEFTQLMKEYNLFYSKFQCFYLDKTLTMTKSKLKDKQIIDILKYQIKNATNWCNQYKIDINKNCKYLENKFSFNSTIQFFLN